MFEYLICNVPDEDLFHQQCRALEKHIPNLVKGRLLHDVDDSKMQFYYKDSKEIAVCNCYYVRELYVKSEIDLTQFFPNAK